MCRKASLASVIWGGGVSFGNWTSCGGTGWASAWAGVVVCGDVAGWVPNALQGFSTPPPLVNGASYVPGLGYVSFAVKMPV